MRIRTLAGLPLPHELVADISRVIVLSDLTEHATPKHGVELGAATNHRPRP